MVQARPLMITEAGLDRADCVFSNRFEGPLVFYYSCRRAPSPWPCPPPPPQRQAQRRASFSSSESSERAQRGTPTERKRREASKTRARPRRAEASRQRDCERAMEVGGDLESLLETIKSSEVRHRIPRAFSRRRFRRPVPCPFIIPLSLGFDLVQGAMYSLLCSGWVRAREIRGLVGSLISRRSPICIIALEALCPIVVVLVRDSFCCSLPFAFGVRANCISILFYFWNDGWMLVSCSCHEVKCSVLTVHWF
jgi:hypothetical protein